MGTHPLHAVVLGHAVAYHHHSDCTTRGFGGAESFHLRGWGLKSSGSQGATHLFLAFIPHEGLRGCPRVILPIEFVHDLPIQ